MGYCKRCGNPVANTARYCGVCGTEVLPLSTYNTAVNVRTNPEEQWRPATTPELGGPARHIQTNRGLFKLIIFNIFTIGIYGYYFVYRMAQDMNTMCEDDDQNTGGLIAFILLNIITCGIYGIYWWYEIANRLSLNAPRYNIYIGENGSSFLLWYLLGIVSCGIATLVAYHTVIRNVNYLAAAYNKQHGFYQY